MSGEVLKCHRVCVIRKQCPVYLYIKITKSCGDMGPVYLVSRHTGMHFRYHPHIN